MSSQNEGVPGSRIGLLIGWAVMLSATFVKAGEAALRVPPVEAVMIDGTDADWVDRGFRADALADVRVGRRPGLPPSPVVRLGRDDGGLLVFVRAADNTPANAAADGGDRVEVFVADPRASGKGFQLTVVPSRTSPRGTPAVTWADKRADTATPLTVEAASTGDGDGYAIELRLPWSNFPGFKNAADKSAVEHCLQVYVEDAAVGLDRVTFGLKPTTESKWLGADQMLLVRPDDRASPPARLAAYAEYQRYRRTQVRISDVAADGETRYVLTDAAGRPVGEAAAPGRPGETTRVTVNLPMPQDIPADRTIAVTRTARNGRPAESASVVPAGPLGRGDALAAAEFRFDATVFAGPAFPAGDFADPLAIEDLIGPYTVTRRYFDADFNEVTSADKPGRYGALVTIAGQNGLTGRRQMTLFRTPRPFRWWTESVGGQALAPPDVLGVPNGVTRQQQKLIGHWLAQAVRSDATHNGSAATVLAALGETDPAAPPFVERTGPYARDEHWWHTLNKKLGTAKSYPYMTVLPADYATPGSADKTYPLLVFLHGVGQCGDDPTHLADWGPMPVLRGRRDNPFIAVAPRCPYREYWGVDKLNDLLDGLAAKYRVDPSRIYVTGLSMGGGGTWDFAAAFPDRVAAAVPICANGDFDDLDRLKDVPTWAFLGANDDSVDAGKARAAFARLKALGGDATLTVYADGGHDIWDRAYGSDALYAWLLAHRRAGF